jgi:predicted ester cyclase
MSSNKETIRRMFEEVINEGQLDRIDELFDPEFTSETPQGTLDREGFREYVKAWRAGFSDIHCQVHDLVEEGDKVAWSVRATGTHDGEFMGIPATQHTVDFDSLNIGEFRDGKGYRHKVLMNDLKMMSQLGLSPGGPGAT